LRLINGNNIVFRYLKRVQVVGKVGAVTEYISCHLICFLSRGVAAYGGFFLAFLRAEEERGVSVKESGGHSFVSGGHVLAKEGIGKVCNRPEGMGEVFSFCYVYWSRKSVEMPPSSFTTKMSELDG